MSNELDILRANIAACGQRIQKLAYSLHKNRATFPLTLARVESLTDDQEESIDALSLRYSQCVAMIQDQIFRGIAYVEREDLSDKSNRDKTRLMEKLGAIQSADDFGTAAVLRNKFFAPLSGRGQLQNRTTETCFGGSRIRNRILWRHQGFTHP